MILGALKGRLPTQHRDGGHVGELTQGSQVNAIPPIPGMSAAGSIAALWGLLLTSVSPIVYPSDGTW